jgi:hypothetical protein
MSKGTHEKVITYQTFEKLNSLWRTFSDVSHLSKLFFAMPDEWVKFILKIYTQNFSIILYHYLVVHNFPYKQIKTE